MKKSVLAGIVSIILVNHLQAQNPTFQSPIYNIKGTQSNEIFSVTHDNSGNSYFCGKHADTLQFGSSNLPNGNGGAFWGKANASGSIVWLKQGGSPSPASDKATEITLDKNGNVYVCGSIPGHLTCSFNGSSVAPGSIGFVVKYDGNGNFIWARGYSANIYSIAIDNNNIPIINYGDNSIYKLNPADGEEDYLNPGAINGNLANAGLHNIKIDKHNNIIVHAGNKIRKFDNSFTVLWTQNITASLIENFRINLDTAGNVYSSFYGLFGTVTIGTISKSNFPNGYAYKLDENTGAPVFVDSIRIGGNASKIKEIIPDMNGNYYVTGDGAFNTPVVLKLDASKLIVWQKNFSANAPVNDLDFVTDDCVLAGGKHSGTAVFDSYTLKLPNGITSGIDNSYLIGLCDGALSIAENESTEGVMIYPNPSNNVFFIQLNEVYSNSLVEIYDILGNKVHNQRIASASAKLDLSLNTGVYFLTISVAGKQIVQKLVIN